MIKKRYSPGVLYGEDLKALYADAKENNFAIPAINTIGTNSINATLEAAAKVNSPVIIQFGAGGAQFLAGKGMPDTNFQATITGTVSGALHIHNVAKYYGVPVVVHTDHASKKWLPWIDGLIEIGEAYFKEKQRPLFSSHMLDLSDEPLEENIEFSCTYYERLAPLGMGLEIELGITGGEEEDVNNNHVEKEKLYTSPADIAFAFERLSSIGPMFTIAASFGNVHGVFKQNNIELRPEILKNSQAYVQHKYHTGDKPIFFVFHGGSGTPRNQIQEAISYGTIKMNLNTDLQWAFWEGVLETYNQNHKYMQSQLGNPDGEDEPNKKYYDPSTWLRKGEENFVKRLITSFEELNCINRNL